MKKHAYLVTVYNNFEILKKLILLLDDERTDIFIHLDRKVEQFDFDFFHQLITKSRLIFVPRVKVYWASFTQVHSILNLFEAAVKGQYHYYHLISGVDLPIKPQNYIHDFFSNQDHEFIAISPHVTKYHDRAKYYHLFLDNEYYRKYKLIKGTREILTILQKIVGINRFRNSGLQVHDGWDWYSITHALVEYILDNKDIIKRYFHTSLCPSELFVPTLVMSSEKWVNRVYSFSGLKTASQRLIDWKRGTPYTFTRNDFDELINEKDCMFARKFDEKIDMEIVDMIFNHLSRQL